MQTHVETVRRLSLCVPMVTLRQVELMWLDRALRRFARAATHHDRNAGEEIAMLPPLVDELPAYVAANTLARAALKWSRELRPEDLGWSTAFEVKPRDPRVTLAEFALALSRALDAERPELFQGAEGELLEVVDIVLGLSELTTFDVAEEMALQVRQLRDVIP